MFTQYIYIMVVILSLTIIIPIFVNVDTLLKRATEAKQLLIDRLYEQNLNHMASKAKKRIHNFFTIYFFYIIYIKNAKP